MYDFDIISAILCGRGYMRTTKVQNINTNPQAAQCLCLLLPE